MATAHVVITDVNADAPAVVGIFDGLKFFLAQRLPSRSYYVNQIEANGGRVVKIEEQADHIIADHLRKDCPAGSISYRFIESAMKNGELPDPRDHPAGPIAGRVREVGSSKPTKGTRTPFTAEDDKVLWLWVEESKRKGNDEVKGNEIYKRLAEQNSRHTFQSWRDRYIKYLMGEPPAGVDSNVAANTLPTPPAAPDTQAELEPARAANPEDDEEESVDGADEELEFAEEDFDDLLKEAADIENIPAASLANAWAAFESQRPDHSAEAWRTFYEEHVRPVYLKQRAERRKAEKAERRKQKSESAVADYVAEQQAIKNAASTDAITREKATSGIPPMQSVSSGSQGIKRKLDEVASQTVDGHKKSRAGAPRVVNGGINETAPHDRQSLSASQAPGALSTQPIELLSSEDDEEKGLEEDDRENLPASELNKAAQVQLEAEQQLAGSKAFFTSESHRTAQSQILSDRTARSDPALAEARIPGMVSEHPVVAVDREPGPPRTPELAPLHVNSAAEGQPSQITPTRLLKTNGDLLTEANLASQQAQHKQSLLRGSDLPEDDEAQDQNEYLNVLQDLVNNTGNASSDPTHAFRQHSSLRDDSSGPGVDIALQGVSLGLNDFEFGPMQDLPMSSQQEIDDAFVEAINWPESPKVSQPVVVKPESVEFETQVAYPQLPSQQLDDLSQDIGPTYPAQSATLPQVSYPEIRQQVEEALDPQTHLSQVLSESNEAHHGGHSPLFEKESSYAILEREDHSSQDESDEDEVDLSIAAPEGGWDRLSPDKGSVVVATEEVEDNGQAEVVTVEEELVEVSSDSSSTSSSSESSDEDRIDDQNLTRAILETQDIVNAETQQPDFDLPLPSDSEEGSSANEESSPPSSPSKKWSKAEDQAIIEGSNAHMSAGQILKKYSLRRTQSALRNRRAVLLKLVSSPRKPIVGKVISRSSRQLERPRRAKAPLSDAIEVDEESEDDFLPSSPSEILSSPIKAATAESQRNLPNIQRPTEEDIDSYVNKMIVFGYKEQAIIDALKCTSMRPELADYVLLEAKAGKGLPGDVAGIWSEEEDRTLESGNARGLKALEEKHTWRELEARMEFLQEWRDEE